MLKFVTLMAMVYYRGKVELVRGILTGDRVQGFPNTRLPLSSEGDSLPASICDNAYGLLTTRETAPTPETLASRDFTGASLHRQD